MAIAAWPSFVIDCPEPKVLAEFYGGLLGWSVTDDGDWAEIRSDSGCICFQQVQDFRKPEWPGQEHPQQVHLDLVVEDLDAGEAEVRERGGTVAEHQPGTTFRVFLDPAGHPFCLCTE